MADFLTRNLRVGRSRNFGNMDDDPIHYPHEHRDTEAIHAKIDELLRAHHDAKTELMTLDTKDVEEIEALRSKTAKKEVG